MKDSDTSTSNARYKSALIEAIETREMLNRELDKFCAIEESVAQMSPSDATHFQLLILADKLKNIRNNVRNILRTIETVDSKLQEEDKKQQAYEDAVRLAGSTSKINPWSQTAIDLVERQFTTSLERFELRLVDAIVEYNKSCATGSSEMSKKQLKAPPPELRNSHQNSVTANQLNQEEKTNLTQTNLPQTNLTSVFSRPSTPSEVQDPHPEEPIQKTKDNLRQRLEAKRNEASQTPVSFNNRLLVCYFCRGNHFTNCCYNYSTHATRKDRCDQIERCSTCVAKIHDGSCRLSHACTACKRSGHSTVMCSYFDDITRELEEVKQKLQEMEDGSIDGTDSSKIDSDFQVKQPSGPSPVTVTPVGEAKCRQLSSIDILKRLLAHGTMQKYLEDLLLLKDMFGFTPFTPFTESFCSPAASLQDYSRNLREMAWTQ
uniref:DUF1758 domain-containing protein n=1 Tax=Steinernema glaseri TaxID=37863 RepID=A0A1I7YTB2_9BILA